MFKCASTFFVLTLSFASFLFASSGEEGGYLSQPLKFITRTDITVCSNEAFEEVSDTRIESISSSRSVSISNFIKSLKNEADLYTETPIAFNLKLCSIGDESLSRIVETFFSQPPYKKRIQMLDLSYNPITKDSCASLRSILELPNLTYLNLVGTSFSLKYVSILLSSLKESGLDAPAYSRKLIFMNKDYIQKAKTTVQVYQRMVNVGLLDKDWDFYHLDFYSRHINQVSKTQSSELFKSFGRMVL